MLARRRRENFWDPDPEAGGEAAGEFTSWAQILAEKIINSRRGEAIVQVQAAAGRPPQKYPECNQGDLEHEYQVQSLIGRFDGIQSWAQM